MMAVGTMAEVDTEAGPKDIRLYIFAKSGKEELFHRSSILSKRALPIINVTYSKQEKL